MSEKLLCSVAYVYYNKHKIQITACIWKETSFLLILNIYKNSMILLYDKYEIRFSLPFNSTAYKAVLDPRVLPASQSHTFAIIVILDLKIHQSMWIQ